MKRYTRILVSAAMLFGTASIGLVVSPLTAGASGGFDQNGLNSGANIFNGTYAQWCTYKGITSGCVNYTSGSVSDLLIMKWNAAWDACNASYLIKNSSGNYVYPTGNPIVCAGAWVDNESNGMVPGGSGVVWHYKIVYSTSCANGGSTFVPSNGGYCVWGNYEVLMDQGTSMGVHTWNALATPNGYGA